MKHTILIVPGLGDSGVEHWQSYWLNEFENAQKVFQKEWHQPQLDHWLTSLNSTINNIEGPIIIVAHSLAVSLINHWSQNNNCKQIVGALLVAPADVDSPLYTPEETRNFSPMPLTQLKYPSIVITSTNDPYISVERAAYFASQWGSQFKNVGAQGHLNSDSQLGNWEEGKEQLSLLIAQISENGK
jgi:predicted alpha/beta hydrolase family esterase